MRAPGLLSRLYPVDWLHLLFLAGNLVVLLTLGSFGQGFWVFLVLDVILLVSVPSVSRVADRLGGRKAVLVRLAYGCIAVPVVFTQVGLMIDAGHRQDLAPHLADIDRWLFGGVDPLMALDRFTVPWFTEIMQWCYTLYLVLIPASILLMAFAARPQVVHRSLFAVVATFYLSYLGYYLVPASGPNIHNNFGPILPCSVTPLPLYTFATDLPGLWLARELRELMFALEVTKHNCFPSGHTAVAITCAVCAAKVGKGWGIAFGTLGVGIILSTVYLRYHYVVDVFAGIALAIFVLIFARRAHRHWERRSAVATRDQEQELEAIAASSPANSPRPSSESGVRSGCH